MSEPLMLLLVMGAFDGDSVMRTTESFMDIGHATVLNFGESNVDL